LESRHHWEKKPEYQRGRELGQTKRLSKYRREEGGLPQRFKLRHIQGNTLTIRRGGKSTWGIKGGGRNNDRKKLINLQQEGQFRIEVQKKKNVDYRRKASRKNVK